MRVRPAHPPALKGTKRPSSAAAPRRPPCVPYTPGSRDGRTRPPLRAVPQEPGPPSPGPANPSVPRPSAHCPPTAWPGKRGPHYAPRGEIRRVPEPVLIHCPRSPCGLSLGSAWAPRPPVPRTGCELPASALQPFSPLRAMIQAVILLARRRDPGGAGPAPPQMAPPLDGPAPGRSVAPPGLARGRLGSQGGTAPEPGAAAARVRDAL